MARTTYNASGPTVQETFTKLKRDWRSTTRGAGGPSAGAEYTGSTDSRFRRTRPGVSGMGRSADDHLGNRYYWMIEQVRAMYREDGIVRQLGTRAVQLQVQRGFTHDPATRDEKLNRNLWDDFHGWWLDPDAIDVAGEYDGPMIEQETMDAVIRDGDFIPVYTEDDQLQLFEGHRLRTPTARQETVHLGVECDSTLRRTAYYLMKEAEAPRGRLTLKDATKVPTWDGDGFRQVFHCYQRQRCSLTRGVTAWHPMLDIAGMFEDVNFALLVKQQMAAALVYSVEHAEKEASSKAPDFGPESKKVDAESKEELIEIDVRAGATANIPKGKKLVTHSPNIPSTETLAHMRLLLSFLSLNLGMPLIAGTLDASETNFSGWRGAMDLAKIGFMVNQDQQARRLNYPLWRIRYGRRMKYGKDGLAKDLRRYAELKTPRGALAVRVQPPRWPYPQPLHDAQANALLVSSGQTSSRRVAANAGADIDDINREQVIDNAQLIMMALKRAEKIKNKFPGADVSWRDLTGRDLPSGMKAAAGENQNQQNNASGGGSNDA